jgi:urate oxidase / 2-oxo-4-hydroxy-4-carboxy-5-ureidoimidazoline decarboxylase
MEQFKSGWKQSYYGKGDVIVYRLHRDGRVPPGRRAVFGASVLLLVYGEAFWPTYTTGDNTGLVATDSMKNFIQRETLNFDGFDLEEYCQFLGAKFLARYPQVEGVQVSASELPFAALPGSEAFVPAGPERATARVELTRGGTIEAATGLRGFKLLRLGGSAFTGFVRDQYTTLPELHDRPLHLWLDLDLHYQRPSDALNQGRCVTAAREIVTATFKTFESGSIQQVIYQMGTKILAELPSIAEVHLEAQNRTWDGVAERDATLGIWTDPRPPYGCLGLRLSR